MYQIIRYPLEGPIGKPVPFLTTYEYFKMTAQEREEHVRHLTTIGDYETLDAAQKHLSKIAGCEFCVGHEMKNEGRVLIAERKDGFKLVFSIVEK